MFKRLALAATIVFGLGQGGLAGEAFVRAGSVTACFDGCSSLLSKGVLDKVPNDKFLDALVRFVLDHTGHGKMPHYPVIHFISQAEIDVLYGQGMGVAKALYINGNMYLLEGFDFRAEPEVFVHEIVHHLQYLDNRGGECIHIIEREAYEVSDAFSRQTGIGSVYDIHADLTMAAFQDCGVVD